MPPTRRWLTSHTDDEITALLYVHANQGYSLRTTAELLSTRFNDPLTTRSAIGCFANRHGIWFHGAQPEWSHARKRNHSAGMKRWHERRRHV